MIVEVKKKVLKNGLTVLIHQDKTTTLAACNLLYKVGSKDETEAQTGFAHLFEHLMFGGSKNATSFDTPVQKASGQNNAFTSTDITNYYITLPVENLETALWLESDRMKDLNISQKALDIQKKVVIEEFKQRYTNQSYGMEWHHLRELVYTTHPYKWPTIGKTFKHIEDADLKDVASFHEKHYKPNNAILCLAGNIEPEYGFALAEKWFEDIPAGHYVKKHYAKEPEQESRREKLVEDNVSAKVITIAFRIENRTSANYYLADLLTDLLSSGNSSRLFQELIVPNQFFEGVNAYVTGEMEPGMLIVKGRLKEGASFEDAEEAIWKSLNGFADSNIDEKEFQKVINKGEAYFSFSNLSVLNKAMALSFYEVMGDANLLNKELDRYANIKKEEVVAYAKSLFKVEKSNVLKYSPKQK